MIEAMKQALEALEELRIYPETPEYSNRSQAITSLRQAIEQAEKQEPVATIEDLEQEIYENTRRFVSHDVMEWMLKRYYTTPQPQREWVEVECPLCGEMAVAHTHPVLTTTPQPQQAEKQEPVAWMHTKIEGVAVPHRPADLDRHPDRWEALYKTPPPCPTCEALARTVMMDQTAHDTTPQPQREWVGLTNEEIQQVFIANSVMVDNGNTYMVAGLRAVNIGRAIEAKLKEKNT